MEWISVKDKLPEFDVDVLVLVKEPQKKYIKYDSRMKVSHCYSWSENPDDIGWYVTGTITHWMPLPDKPESTN